MRYAALLCACAALSACGVLKPEPANNLYVLAPAEAHETAPSPLPWSLKISRARVAPGLDTERIAVVQAPGALTYYIGSAWAAPLPEMARAFFTDSLRRSNAFAAVLSDAEPAKTDRTLLLEIQDCAVEGQAAVHLRLTATLIDSESRKPLLSLPIDETVQAEANHMPQIIAAFNQAFDAAAQKTLAAIRAQTP